jgi:hypothetical protein
LKKIEKGGVTAREPINHFPAWIAMEGPEFVPRSSAVPFNDRHRILESAPPAQGAFPDYLSAPLLDLGTPLPREKLVQPCIE